jgi:hypothetical protein
MWNLGNGTRALLLAMVVMTLRFIAGAGAVAYVALNQVEPQWDPLGDYPVQKILNKDHKVSLTDTSNNVVKVDAIKCADEPAQVAGSLRWQSVKPPGIVLMIGSGTGTRKQGCQEMFFENPIPPEVKAVIKSGGPTVWVITGTETPLRDGQQGVPRAWTTEQFEVVP